MYAELDFNPSAIPKIVSAMFGTANLRPSLFHVGVAVVGLGVLCHKAVTYLVLYPLFRLLFGTLYPAYASYKAVRTKNVKEYVKWMMYWIVFALFTCIETFTDVFLSWFPFYYEIKIVLVIWLLSPATKGSSILYRKFVHPMLSSREQEIDEYITKAKEQSYKQVLDLGSKGVSALMQTAIKGGGGIVNQLRKSYSLSDLTDPGQDDGRDETDIVITDPRLLRRRRSPHRSSSSTSAMYFSEVDVRADRIASIQSAEDISSGYSSSEGLYSGQPPKLLAREGLHRAGSLTRSRTSRVTRSTIIKKSGGSDDSDENEIFDTNIVFDNDKVRKILPVAEEKVDASSEDEFLDTLDTMHDKLGEDLNIYNKSHCTSSLLTACRERGTNLDVINCSLTKNSSIHSDPSISAALGDTDKPNKISVNVNTLNIVNITKDVNTFSKFLHNLIESKIEKNDTGSCKEDPKYDDNTITLMEDRRQAEPRKQSEPNVKAETRGGRYNKKAAPPPPQEETYVTDPSPIKATLILKPGVVKNLGVKESPSKEVFIQSPKSKRRNNVNRQPSSVSTSSNASRSKRSLSKLMKLPKKMVFWNKDELPVPQPSEKRSSWHSFVDGGLKPLVDSKLQSKSDNDLTKINNMVTSLHGSGISKTDSQLSINSLTDSPLAHRRLKIIRRYVDEDID